ncbi:hypothetical protein ACA910_001134 [Epithemia clementina (nom. ined.)]
MPTKRETAEPTEKPTYKPTERETAEPTEKPTYKPTERETDEPTDKPVYRPYETYKPSPYPIYNKGKGKGGNYPPSPASSKGKGKGKSGKNSPSTKGKRWSKGKGSYEGHSQCRYRVLKVAQKWTGAVLEPDGTMVEDPAHASTLMGQQAAYVGSVYDRPGGYEVGWDLEDCTRLDDGNFWSCVGNYVDLYGCEGHLAFSGIYSDHTETSHMVITGGTGDFLGAIGSIYTEYDEYSGYSLVTITIQ